MKQIRSILLQFHCLARPHSFAQKLSNLYLVHRSIQRPWRPHFTCACAAPKHRHVTVKNWLKTNRITGAGLKYHILWRIYVMHLCCISNFISMFSLEFNNKLWWKSFIFFKGQNIKKSAKKILNVGYFPFFILFHITFLLIFCQKAWVDFAVPNCLSMSLFTKNVQDIIYHCV